MGSVGSTLLHLKHFPTQTKVPRRWDSNTLTPSIEGVVGVALELVRGVFLGPLAELVQEREQHYGKQSVRDRTEEFVRPVPVNGLADQAAGHREVSRLVHEVEGQRDEEARPGIVGIDLPAEL